MAEPVGGNPGGNNKKWWIIGCSGCLLVVIVAVALLVWGGGALVSQWQQGNSAVNKEIFGGEPKGYITLWGMPLESDGEVTRFSILMSSSTQHMVIALDQPSAELPLSGLSLDNPEAMEAQIKAALGAASTQNEEMSMDQLEVDEVVVGNLNGKAFPVLHAKGRRKHAPEYSPTTIALLPLEGDRSVMLLSIDPTVETLNAEEDFSEQYAALDREIQALIEDSTLDDRLQGQ
jgi:hypothetical protein